GPRMYGWSERRRRASGPVRRPDGGRLLRHPGSKLVRGCERIVLSASLARVSEATASFLARRCLLEGQLVPRGRCAIIDRRRFEPRTKNGNPRATLRPSTAIFR